MPTWTQPLAAAAFALVGWGLVLAALVPASRLPRPGFVLAHYALDLGVFGALFWLYYRLFPQAGPFATMAVAMATMLVAEAVVWTFFYQGELWFLTWVDWIVPAFLVASVIYGAGAWAR